MAIILEYNGCPKWRVVKEGEEIFLHCPTTQTRIPITLGELPEGASFEEGEADLPTGTELDAEPDFGEGLSAILTESMKRRGLTSEQMGVEFLKMVEYIILKNAELNDVTV